MRFHLIVQSLKNDCFFFIKKADEMFDQITAFIFEIKLPQTTRKLGNKI